MRTMMKNGFGKRLKAYRKAHKLTQRELAELMDISTNHVSVLERESKLPRASTIAAFETLIIRDELSKYVDTSEWSDLNIKEYEELIRCIDRLLEEKRREAMEAIIKLLNLM